MPYQRRRRFRVRQRSGLRRRTFLSGSAPVSSRSLALCSASAFLASRQRAKSCPIGYKPSSIPSRAPYFPTLYRCRRNRFPTGGHREDTFARVSATSAERECPLFRRCYRRGRIECSTHESPNWQATKVLVGLCPSIDFDRGRKMVDAMLVYIEARHRDWF
jgi:hypothetical protein